MSSAQYFILLSIDDNSIGRCGQHLDGVLLGTKDPLELLFPGGDSSDSEESYSEASAHFCNQLVCEAIRAAMDSEVRFSYILEVGAGTGATTATILPSLPANQVEYWFTDISETFLSRAQRRWGRQYPFVKYELFNAQSHPLEQGIAVHRFDIAVAVNVLHATTDLSVTLTNIKLLLRSGGLLLLSEYTEVEQTALADATFGLTEGWWLFDDGRKYVLQSREQWSTWFDAHGFDLACASHHRVMEWQTVFVARACDLIAVGRIPKRLCSWKGGCLVTGGLGGVGLMTATWLIGCGATELFLASRSGKTNSQLDEARLKSVQESSVHIVQVECDITEQGRIQALQSSTIEGIVHSAGVLADGLVENQTITSFQAVTGAKVVAADHMHRAFSDRGLNYFVVYSSMAGVFGSPGQSPHCMANAALDSFVHHRRGQGLVALAVQWGTWSNIGYAARVGADIRTDNVGFLRSFPPSVGMRSLCSVCSSDIAAAVITPIVGDAASLFPSTRHLVSGIANMVRRDQEQHSSKVKSDGTRPMMARPECVVKEAQSTACVIADHEMLTLVASSVKESTGLCLAADEPLGEGGVDSLGSIQVRSSLQSAVREEISIPSTLISSTSTIRAISSFLCEQVHQVRFLPEQVPLLPFVGPSESQSGAREFVITGSSCRIGGGKGTHGLWAACCNMASLVSKEPPTRWQVAVQACATHARCSLSAAFIESIDEFDATFFGLSAAKVRGMDPTERLLLEVSVESINDAGYTLTSSVLKETVIITCVATSDYALHGSQEILTPRLLAQVLGTDAHFENCNTICSSSHVAVHRACTLLEGTQCSAALIGGAMVLLNPKTSFGTDDMGILSPSGVARPFDRDADGLVRGEGIGAIVLECAGSQPVQATFVGSFTNTDNPSMLLADHKEAQWALKSALSREWCCWS